MCFSNLKFNIFFCDFLATVHTILLYHIYLCLVPDNVHLVFSLLTLYDINTPLWIVH